MQQIRLNALFLLSTEVESIEEDISESLAIVFTISKVLKYKYL